MKWKALFDEWTIIKGERICNYCITSMTIDESGIVAKVQGTQLYDVTIDRKVNMYCSCPQFFHFGRCKHLAGLLLKNDLNRESGEQFLAFDYSEHEQRLAEVLSKQSEYTVQLAEERSRRAKEREAAKQERERIRREEAEKARLQREEERRVEREQRAIEREKARKERLEREEQDRRRKLIDKLSLLDIPNLQDYTTEELKNMRLEMQPQITAKREEKARAQRVAEAAIREEQRRKEAELRAKKRQEQEERERQEYEKRMAALKAKLTPLTRDKNNEVTIHAGEYLSLIVRPSLLSYNVFGCYCQVVCTSGFFIPPTVLGQYKGKYCVWYTAFGSEENKYHNGQLWTDYMEEDENRIVRTYVSNQMDRLYPKDREWSDTQFLVFGREKGLYKFFGVFDIEQVIDRNPFQIIYKKTANTFRYKWKKETPPDPKLAALFDELLAKLRESQDAKGKEE